MKSTTDGEERRSALDATVEVLAMDLVDPEELAAYAGHHERETRRRERDRGGCR